MDRYKVLKEEIKVLGSRVGDKIGSDETSREHGMVRRSHRVTTEICRSQINTSQILNCAQITLLPSLACESLLVLQMIFTNTIQTTHMCHLNQLAMMPKDNHDGNCYDTITNRWLGYFTLFACVYVKVYSE